ncbi:ABC transporter permease subunit [candidate division KSB3 bacterium]|nr:ABC transporter permease subunit [candidate division KSB3 bacterium]
MDLRRNIFCYLMIAPALLFVSVLSIYPMLATLRLSFLQYDLLRIGAEGTPFVGLRNFKEIFQDRRFLQALRNTVMFCVIIVGSLMFLGLLVAQLLNLDFRGRGVLRSLVLLPWVMPPVISAAIWMWFYQTERSPINQVLRKFGLIQRNIGFLTDATNQWGPVSVPMLAVSSVRVWNGLAFFAVMLLAGLQSIPVELYESAQIDGAGSISRFRFVTFPMLRPVIVILVTLSTIATLGHFAVNYIMTSGGPANLTNILGVMAYQQAFFFFRYDLGAAINSLILLMTGTIAAFYIRATLGES